MMMFMIMLRLKEPTSSSTEELVRIQLREERAKAENKPMWILCRKHRSSLDKKRDFFFKLFLAIFLVSSNESPKS